MAEYDIFTLPDGQKVRLPKGMSRAEKVEALNSFTSSQPAPKPADMSVWGRIKDNVIGVDDSVESTGEKIGNWVRGGTAAVARGMADVPAIPANLLQLGAAGVEKATGMEQPSAVSRALNALPDTRDMLASVPVIGPESQYVAPGRVGQFVSTGGEFAGGAGLLGGPSAMIRYGAAPGVASEGAGQTAEALGASEGVQTAARIGAGLGTSLAMTPKPMQFTRGADADDLETANRLMQQGVRPTAGQTKNSSRLAAAEGTLAPLDDQLDDFTAAAMRSVGSTARRATPKVLRAEQNKITKGMNEILDVDVPITPDVGQKVMTAAGDYFETTAGKNLPVTLRKISDQLMDFATDPSPLNSVIPAKTLREWRTKLGTYTTSSDEGIREAAHALREVIDDATHGTLRALGREQDVTRLAKLREQYRNFLTIADASLRGGREGARGILTPERVQTASARVMGRQQVATGGGTPLARLAEDARGFIGAFPTVNAGGTRSPLTAGAQALGGAGLGAFAGNSIAGTPGAVIGAMAGTVAPDLAQRFMRSGLVQSGMMNPSQLAIPPGLAAPGLLSDSQD